MKFVEKIRTHIFCQPIFVLENRVVYEIRMKTTAEPTGVTYEHYGAKEMWFVFG
jgi:hypothetical protein